MQHCGGTTTSSQEEDKLPLDRSGSHTFVPIEYFNLPDTCWKSNVVGCEQSRFLESVSDNFLIEVVEVLGKGDTKLDLLLAATEGLAEDAMLIGMPGSSYHEGRPYPSLQLPEKGLKRGGFWFLLLSNKRQDKSKWPPVVPGEV